MSDKKEPEKKKKSEVPVWFVRGVSIELRAEVAAAAERAGMNIGTWVVRALRAALERPEGQGAPSGQGGAGDDLRALVTVLAAQLTALESRIECLEAGLTPPAIPGWQKRQGSTLDAVEPAGGAEMSETPRTHPRASGGAGRRSPRPWTDVDDAELRRIFDQGGTQADAARELGRSDGMINEHWKALGLPVPPRKGRKLK